MPGLAFGAAPTQYTSSFFDSCTNVAANDAMTCWMSAAFKWTQAAIWSLSIAAVVFAGVVYMTSAGDTNRLGFAKKLLWGAFSAIVVVVLGRFFLTKVIGVPWAL